MKQLLIFFYGLLALCLSAWAGLDDPQYREIRLQGEYTFSAVIAEAREQLGVEISLPVKANSRASSTYNHVISLRQLVDAIVMHFAQEGVPLDWRFKGQRLSFTRRDVVKPKPQARVAPKKTYGQNKYPVPVIRETPEQPKEHPTRPSWAERSSAHSSSTQRNSSSTSMGGSRQEYSRPSVTSTQTQAPKVWSDLEAPSVSITDLDDGISAFPVQMPERSSQRERIVVKSPHAHDSSFGSVSTPSSTSAPLSAISPTRGTSSIGSTGQTPTPVQRAPRGNKFGITPYPEGAVSFINDAPSIVPGASRENYIEWKTRLEGALQNGNRAALVNEQKDLERRLHWLRSRLK